MTTSRWTDPFLNQLRTETDSHADAALSLIPRDGEKSGISTLFREMNSNDEHPLAQSFPVLDNFFETTGNIPSDVDIDRINRGEEVFRRHAFEGALALLAKSLPEGYQAPNLAIILNISGDLRTHTYKRLLATLQTVVNVSTFHGFQQGGRAVVTAQKLRLLHAGIRHLTRKYRPEFNKKYGEPANQEDMLGTILGFSLLVIEGWRTLDVGLTRNEEEDFLYLWLVFAQMMGIHPRGEHASRAYIPTGVDDATDFYRAYERRHYVDGSENPDGVALAVANLAMLHDRIPLILRILGFGLLPRICMQDLMGAEACARLGISAVVGHPVIKWLIIHAHKIATIFERKEYADYERLGMIFFQGLINRAYDGSVEFTVPTDLQQLDAMVDQKGVHIRPPSGKAMSANPHAS